MNVTRKYSRAYGRESLSCNISVIISIYFCKGAISRSILSLLYRRRPAERAAVLALRIVAKPLVANVTPDQLGVSNVTVEGQALTNASPLEGILSTFEGNQSLTEGSLEGDALVNSTTEDATAVGDGLTTADNDVEDLVLKGGRGNDTLEGGTGEDFLKGGQREDILRGGEGDDRLQGDMGSDVLEGGAGNDALDGGKGFDTLDGGAGDDILTGGGAADTFVQDFSEPGNDTITDFNPEEDVIDFRGGNDFGKITVSGVEGGTLISAGEGNSLFIANPLDKS